MADVKFTELPAASAANATDILAKVNDPSGTPISQKVTLTQIGTALGSTPGVKVYRAIINQSGTNAPVATVLQNTLGGTVVWTRNDVGDYSATLSGAFPAAKTIVQPTAFPGNDSTQCFFDRPSGNVLNLLTGTDGNIPGGWSLEILVFP